MFYISKIGIVDGFLPTKLQVYSGCLTFVRLYAGACVRSEPDFDEVLEVVLCMLLVLRLCVRFSWMISLAELCGTVSIQETIVGGASRWEVGGDYFTGVAIVLGMSYCIKQLRPWMMLRGLIPTSHNT